MTMIEVGIARETKIKIETGIETETAIVNETRKKIVRRIGTVRKMRLVELLQQH